ncbi:hypothetical protein PVAP13_7NG427300 [Panicum virgatum]|uniref:Uncharacterized protein n=1 Tax=Panicum virgatum TaxID=38727 RepID=A0A8T0Q9Q6_PANVG|nr:hypothetical protein PVAP13_7NG427300 [Panicum virgatum]
MASRAGEPSRSTTTIVSSMRFYHVLKINGYANTLNVHNGPRPSFNSRPFPAGGRTWHISYRPMGSPHHPENTDSISFYLVLDDVVDEAEEKPVHKHSRTTRTNNFSKSRDRAFGYERFIGREALEASEYLKDDCFAVAVNVHVVRGTPSSKAAVPDSDDDMRRHLGDLLSSGEGADVAFRVGGETFAAHRLVLAARSPVLRAELYGPMREGTTTDAIRIDEMEARVFEALLVFMYTDTWPEMEGEDESAMSQHLLVAADRYGLRRLKLMCQEAQDTLRNHIDADSVASLLALAERHHCPRLEEECSNFLSSAAALCRAP